MPERAGVRARFTRTKVGRARFSQPRGLRPSDSPTHSADAEVPTKRELDAWVVNARKSTAFSYQARDVRMGRPNAAQPAEPCALEIRTVRSEGMLTRIASTPPALLHGAQTGETSPRLEERRRARSCAPRSRVLLASRAQSPRRVDSRNCEGG